MKFLTEEDVKWKSFEEYSEAKRQLNKKVYTIPWRDKFSRRPSVGPCQELARKSTATTCEEFFDFYLSNANANNDQPIRLRGCTLDELEMVAYNWMNESGNPNGLSLKTFFYGVVMHVIIETFIGLAKEKEATEAFIKCGYRVEESTSDEDADMGIDFKVCDDSGVKWLVQIKPASFFLGFQPDLFKDRRHVFAKHELGHERYPGVKYIYMIYDAWVDGKWLYNEDKKSYFFKYNELIDFDGNLIYDKDKLMSSKREKIEF